MSSNLRIGTGFDVHRFAENRPLFLGGVSIPSAVGLEGHSDADVLLHAITDAVLGALAWGDIGQWFPDTDAQWKGSDSKVLFATVWRKVKEEGWHLINCDSTIVAEQPKIAPHMKSITESIAGLFGVEASRVSVKATTFEKMGSLGRSEGMVAQSVVLLEK